MVRWLVLAFALASASFSSAHAAEPLTIFAAASLKNVIDQTGLAYTAKTGIEVKASYAASSVLAKQIEQGAPADIFASADLEWMDYVAKRQLIRPQTRINLLGNALVVIAPKSAALQRLTLDRAAFLAALGSDGKLVTGEVNSVPVGKYAKMALTSLGIWTDVEARIAGVDNVRAALTFVVRGEAPLGVVYATDAAVEPNVKILATFPETSHPAIIYPFAVTTSGRNEAAQFIEFLRSPEVGTIFLKAGFNVIDHSKPTN